MSEVPAHDSGPEEPRRSASERFEVAASAQDAAAMRRALDPANASLQQALHLSYRLLQVAMLALVAVFLLSGFQTVQEGSTGIRTVFGRVWGEPGAEAVTPGLTPFWPYPVGELEAFPQRRTVVLRSDFWPRLASDATTIDEASVSADPSAGLRAGTDGFVIVAGGDLAHLRLEAEYAVTDPVALLEHSTPQAADAVVRSALRRAVVASASRLTLAELLESREELASEIRATAQQSLDGLGLGIDLAGVAVTDRSAPLAVRNQIVAVQARGEEARIWVEKARQEASKTLLGAAGPAYEEVLGLVARYETALTAGDSGAAEAGLEAIGKRLEQPDVGGEAARIIARANAYGVAIESTLGKEARRVKSLAPSWRENPRQLVRQLWLEGVRSVLDQKEVEVFSMPTDLGSMDVSIASSPDIMQARRNAELERKKREAQMLGAGDASWQLGSRQIIIDKAGRRLDATGTKGQGRE